MKKFWTCPKCWYWLNRVEWQTCLRCKYERVKVLSLTK
jgi:hypothetical protein